MPVASILTRIARRTLDLVLLGLILLVIGVVVLARGIPAVTGGATFVVGGGSMEPTIPFGSAVTVVPVAAEQLATGDIVSIQVGTDHAVFTHRIVRLVPRSDGLWLETKGDANADNDPSIIPATAVIGRLALSVPYAGYAVRLFSSLQGVAFLIALGILVLAGAWFLESLEEDIETTVRRRAASATATATASAAAILPEPPSGQGVAG